MVGWGGCADQCFCGVGGVVGLGSKLPRIVEAGGVVEFRNPSGQFPNTTVEFLNTAVSVSEYQFPNTTV